MPLISFFFPEYLIITAGGTKFRSSDLEEFGKLVL